MAKENNVICRAFRRRLARLTSGADSALSPVKYIALGTGGCTAEGTVIPPIDTQSALKQEVARYPVKAPEFVVPETVRYTITVAEEELVGEGINELALIAEDGTFYMVRTHLSKFKEGDEEFTFSFDTQF